MADTQPTDCSDDLIRRARSDRDALGQLYDHHFDGLFRYCKHRLFVREVAEDVSASVFLAVAESIRSFRGRTETDFSNWLFRIASNQVNAYIRKQRRQQTLLAAAARQGRINASPSVKPVDDPDWPHLYAAIASLPAKAQTVVTLRSFEHLSFDQIALIMGVKPATARVIFHRALKELNARLDDSMASD